MENIIIWIVFCKLPESKIGEVYMKYLFMQDSIILEGVVETTAALPSGSETTADSLVLQDAQNFELHTFLRTNDTISSAPAIRAIIDD